MICQSIVHSTGRRCNHNRKPGYGAFCGLHGKAEKARLDREALQIKFEGEAQLQLELRVREQQAEKKARLEIVNQLQVQQQELVRHAQELAKQKELAIQAHKQLNFLRSEGVFFLESLHQRIDQQDQRIDQQDQRLAPLEHLGHMFIKKIYKKRPNIKKIDFLAISEKRREKILLQTSQKRHKVLSARREQLMLL